MRERDRATQVQEVLRLQTDKIRKEPLQGSSGIWNEERILKAVREKCQVTPLGQTHQNNRRFLNRNFKSKEGMG
jgi:hypothetical protein